MRLLIISSEFPPGPGGIGTHAHQLAWHLRHAGWEVAVIARQDYASEDEIKTFSQSQPFPIVRLRPVPGLPREALYRWRVATAWVERWHPDVVLATGQRAVWLTAWLAGRYRLPWLAVGHGTEFGLTVAWQRALTRWSFQWATAVVCVSRYTWQRMRALGIEPRTERVIPNGADGQRFRILSATEVADVRPRLGLAGARLLLTVGSVTERKGQSVVIRALPTILREAPDTHYLIAGMPTNQADFARLASDLGVADHVHFLGVVDTGTLVSLLNACDVFVMASQHTRGGDFEGYGIAVVEAALCGKPAVVARGSGLDEAIVDGQTGLAVPQGDPSAVAQAILSLLANDGQRYRMGRAARDRALEEQTWERRAREYHLVLRALLAPPGGGLARAPGHAKGAQP